MYVEDFNGDESEDEDVVGVEPKRKRQANRVWIKKEEFSSAEDAEKAVLSQHIWKKSSTKSTLDGCKVEYRCTKGKYRVLECPAGLYLLYHSTNLKVSLFTTECGHDNHNADLPTRGLRHEMKTFVKQKYEDGIKKPNAILAIIRQQNMTEPPKSKLIAYLKQLRCEKYGNSTVLGTEIIEWCEARMKIPDLKDDPFVLNYTVRCESFDPEEQDIKIVLSTRRLLENLKKSDMVQIDATYKIIWQGYPVMIVGTSDKGQVFHPFAIAVCKGESANDFGYIFDALHNFDLEWKPRLLLADASESITRGFVNIFGVPSVRIMCFFHVLQNVEKHFKRLTKYKDLKQDIYALQTCKDESTFLKASNLFLEKWSGTDDDQVKEFIHYFNSQWLEKNSKWYEGIAVGYPSTNNGLEATNSVIKKEYTLRERLPVGQFLHNILELLVRWSKERNPESPNFKKFCEVPTISLQQWTCAYQWAMLNKKVLQENSEEDGSKVFYTCSDSINQSIDVEQLSIYKDKEGKWETFDEFKNYSYSVWMINIDCKDLNLSKCTCPYFLKHLNCKHVLGMKIRLKLVDVPTEAKLIPLGQKRKRGRPAKAKKALILQ